MQQFCIESAPPPCKLHKKAPLPLSLSGRGAYFRVVSLCGNAVRTRGARDRIHFGKRLNADPFEARRAPRRISSGRFPEPGENLGHRRGDHRSPAKPQRQTSSLHRLPRRRAANVSLRGDVTSVGATIGRPQKQNDKCHPCPASRRRGSRFLSVRFGIEVDAEEVQGVEQSVRGHFGEPEPRFQRAAPESGALPAEEPPLVKIGFGIRLSG